MKRGVPAGATVLQPRGEIREIEATLTLSENLREIVRI